MAQTRITYVGGTDEEHRAFETIVADGGSTIVRFLAPGDAVATLMARTTDLLLIDLLQTSHDVLTLMKTASR